MIYWDYEENEAVTRNVKNHHTCRVNAEQALNMAIGYEERGEKELAEVWFVEALTFEDMAVTQYPI